MFDEDYVWYLAYGSNISIDRLNCYIVGGKPNGIKRNYDGCRVQDSPKSAIKRIIHHELYFSQESKTWNNGGVAFIKNETDMSISTFAMMYKITKQQLEDILLLPNL